MSEFLNRSFFAGELARLAEAYSQEIGGKKVAMLIMLRDGQALKLEGKPTCTDTYLLCDIKAAGGMSRAVIPYVSIVGVNLTAESGGTMGFTR